MEFTFEDLGHLELTETLLEQYNELIFELTGKDKKASLEDLVEVQNRTESELLTCALNEDGLLVGVVHGSYAFTPPNPAIFINTVVVHKDCRGSGLGTQLMQTAEDLMLKKWPSTFKILLTSAPKRGTRGFYERLGFIARVPENDNETIVYMKKIEDHTS